MIWLFKDEEWESVLGKIRCRVRSKDDIGYYTAFSYGTIKYFV